MTIIWSPAMKAEAEGYIKNLRNSHKRAYATAYWVFLTGKSAATAPSAPVGLNIRAVRAVENHLWGLLQTK
jgi:hypothetical protein